MVPNPDGSFTYTPNAGFYGTDTITFKAHDGPFLTSDDFTVTVNVSLAAPNDAAAAQVDVNHGVVTGNLLAGDPNQDVLTVTDVINDAGTDGTFTVVGTYGELVVQSDGSYTYTLAATPAEQAALFSLGSGHVANDIFLYTVSDGQGATAQADLTVAVTGEAPTISIAAITGDNVINASEANVGFSITGSEAGADGLPIMVTIVDGNGAAVESYNITGAQGGWSVNVTSAQATALADGSYTVTAQVTDQFGNPSTTATQTLEVHETLPTVTIDALALDGDNVINHAEAQDGVTLSGSVTGQTALSTFSITVIDGSFTNTYSATVNAAGTGWTATIPGEDATQLQDGASALTVSAQVTDQFGNTSATATQTFTVEETLPTVTIDALALDGDNVINHAEAQDGVTLSGSVTGQAALSTFSITVIDESFTNTYSAVVNTAGTGWTATIPGEDATQLQDGVGALTVTAQVTDQFGNTSATATQTFTVDETAPTVTINTLAGDNVLNALEAQSNLTIGGSASGVEDGQHVTVTFNNHSYDAVVTSNAWTTTVAASALTHAMLPDGSYTVTANVSDAAGNPATSATRTMKVDETAPVIAVPGAQTLGFNKAMTISGVSLSESGNTDGETFTVTLADTHGNAVGDRNRRVRLRDDASLTITGTLSQVNSDLATLTVTDGTAGSDPDHAAGDRRRQQQCRFADHRGDGERASGDCGAGGTDAWLQQGDGDLRRQPLGERQHRGRDFHGDVGRHARESVGDRNRRVRLRDDAS